MDIATRSDLIGGAVLGDSPTGICRLLRRLTYTLGKHLLRRRNRCMTAPDFTKLTALEEVALAARLDAIRATITHGGEKGRALDSQFCSCCATFFPAEYGLSTGFVAYRADGEIKLSRQLDTIIYDAVRTGPLARLSACDVFASRGCLWLCGIQKKIQSSSDEAKKPADNSIEHCLAQNQELRRMIDRWFHSQSSESPGRLWAQAGSKVSIRSYVVAFAAEGEVASDAESIRTTDGGRLAPPW